MIEFGWVTTKSSFSALFYLLWTSRHCGGWGLLREKCHHRHYHVMYYIQSSFMVWLRTIYRSSHRSGPSQKDCPRKREADCTLFKKYQCPPGLKLSPAFISEAISNFFCSSCDEIMFQIICVYFHNIF